MKQREIRFNCLKAEFACYVLGFFRRFCMVLPSRGKSLFLKSGKMTCLERLTDTLEMFLCSVSVFVSLLRRVLHVSLWDRCEVMQLSGATWCICYETIYKLV